MELKDLSYYCDCSEFQHKELFEGCEFVYDFLKKLSGYMEKKLKPEILGRVMPGATVSENVYLGRGSVIQPGAMVQGPAIIGENCEIRHGAYVGRNVLTGDRVIIGHATETHNSVFLNDSRAPHFAFVGHSILGNKVNLGAGTKISNFKITRSTIKINGNDSGLLKIGAIIGDNSSFGCNTVISPATFIGKHVYCYPLSLLRGFIPSHTVVKLRQTQEMEPLDKERLSL